MTLLNKFAFGLVLLAATTLAQAQIAFRGAASAGVAAPTGGVTYVGAGGVDVQNGCGTANPGIPGGNNGDLLIAVVEAGDSPTIAMTGWTQLFLDNPAGNHTAAVFWRLRTGGDPNGVVQSGSCNVLIARIAAFRGIDPTAPFYTAPLAAGNLVSQNSGAVDTGTQATGDANAMLVYTTHVSDDRTVADPGGTWNEAFDSTTTTGNDAGISLGYQLQTTAGVKGPINNMDLSGAGNDRNTGALFALRPAPAGLTINLPAGTVSGDVMIASIVVRPSSVNITAPAGWAAQAAGLQNAAGNSSRQQIFYKVAGGAEPASYTWLFDSVHTGAAGGIISFSGVDTAAPIDAYGGNLTPQGGDSNVQHRALAITTTVADTMLVSTHSFTSAETWTPPAGMTERVDVASQGTPNAAGISLEMNHVLQPAAGSTGSKLATAGGNGDTGSATLLALRPLVVQPVLHWRLDELGWNGVANEVVDQSGNNLHGQAFNGATTGLVTPAISGSPGTCRYGGFDGNTQFVQVADNALLDVTDELTVMMWLRPTAYPTGGNLKTFVSKDQNYEAHLTSTGTINWWWGGGALELNSAGTVPLNQWTHVALVYSRAGAFQRIYRNGVLDGTNNQNGALVTNNLPFQIAADQGFAGRNFAGLIDEVYVFRSALSAARIAQYMNATRVCATQINHFSISHSGSGVGCVDQPITFTAHDLTHTDVDANALLVNLSTTNAQGTWTGILAGGGVLNDPDPGNGTATYQFPLGANSVTLMFRYASLTGVTETFGFNISGGGFSEVGGVANVSDDPPFTMAQAGFRVRNIEDANEVVPAQISGKPSNTGWNARTLRLQAINTNTSNGSCTNLFANQAQVVLLGGECNNPAACAARQLNVNGSNLATSNSNGGPGAAAYTGLNLNFNASSEADVVLTYPDAGQISLHAEFDLNPLVAGNEMLGSSNNFVVRPLGLAMPGINHSSAATGTLIGAAGDAFAMTVQGYQWALGEDANNDGIPDAGVNLTDNGTVPNFAGTATLGVTANLPGTAPGALNRGAGCVGAPSIALAGGAGTANDWCYSEVGNVLLSATVPDYLGSGVNVTGGSAFDGDAGGGYVGRFKPKYFAVSGTPSLANRSLLACASTFTYLGERLSLDFTLEARNTAGAVTQNYNGAYAKLNLTSAASLGLGARSGATNLTSRIDAALAPAGSFASGVAALTAPFAVRRASPDAPDGPFTGTQFGIAANDADPNLATGVQMGAFNLDVDGAGGNDHVSVGPVTELRYGRLILGNAYGAQSLPLPMVAQTQYWNGSAFAQNTLDSCTSLNRSDIALSFGGGLSACQTAITQATIAFAGGSAPLTLAAPNNAGVVRLTPNLGTAAGTYCAAVGGGTAAATSAAASYLLGRWNDAANPDGDANTSYDDDPAGQGAFGLYGSQPKNFIFFRENY